MRIAPQPDIADKLYVMLDEKEPWGDLPVFVPPSGRMFREWRGNEAERVACTPEQATATLELISRYGHKASIVSELPEKYQTAFLLKGIELKKRMEEFHDAWKYLCGPAS